MIREQLQAFPTMPATVIAQRLGWTRGLTVFKDRVRELRPAYLPANPASRTTYEAGELVVADPAGPDPYSLADAPTTATASSG